MRFFIGESWHFMAAAGLALLIFISALKRSPGIASGLKALRLAAAGLAAFLIIKPSAVFYRPGFEKLALTILLDGSVSMQGPAEKNGAAGKYSASSSWLKKNHAETARAVRTECYIFSDRLYRTDCSSPAAPAPGAAYFESDLDRALNGLFQGGGGERAGPDRVWVITDGLSLGPPGPGGTPGRFPPALKNKIELLGVGDPRTPPGVVIKDFSGPGFAIAHIPFGLKAELASAGWAGRKLELSLKDQDGAVIEKRTFSVRADEEISVSSFTLSAPSVGPRAYRICAGAPGGACQAAKDLTVSVIREKLRVMYLAGRPSFEYACLREFLKSQSAIDLVSFVILRNPEDLPNADERELSLIPFPVNEIFLRDISHFDVFLMQDFDLRRFAPAPSYAASLADFVRKGGGLAVIGGPAAFGSGGYATMDLLSDILPVELSGKPDFDPGRIAQAVPAPHPAAGDAGRREDAAFWRGAPALQGTNIFGPLKPGAKAVFNYSTPQGDEGVLVAEKTSGKGRVIALSGGDTWRWKLGGGRNIKYTGLYGDFWSRILAYLDGTLDLKKVSLEALAHGGFIRPFRLKVLNDSYVPPGEDEGVNIDASLKFGGKVLPVEFEPAARGLYQAQVRPAGYGRHRLKVRVRSGGSFLGSDEAVFEAFQVGPDFVPSDEAGLIKAARENSWNYHRLKDAKPRELLKAMPAASSVRNEVYRFEFGSSRSVMLLLVVLFSAAWIWGRLRGLP
ncbi:MAG: hypothetical protein HY796_00025 [Elusimicrobia bacterium]|nr:hypothetical protein [Elusimicrobiota bacterium]